MSEKNPNFRLNEIMRKERFESLSSTIAWHDKLLATLSAALIGFGITIVKSAQKKMCYALLYVSWGFTFLSIVSAILVFWFSYYYISERMQHEPEVYMKGKKHKASPYEQPLIIFRIILDTNFLLGLLFFLIWVAFNQ